MSYDVCITPPLTTSTSSSTSSSSSSSSTHVSLGADLCGGLAAAGGRVGVSTSKAWMLYVSCIG
jgi:hypothetical protein